MGFMGFGMQKWIYTMRPRKPYSMQRKGSFTVIPTYKRNFKLQPSKNTTGYNFGILFFMVLVVVSGFAIPHWQIHARIHHKNVLAIRSHEDTIAFNFLIRSGKRRLQDGSLLSAYSEFKLAHAIKPNNTSVNQLLTETLTLLCLDHNKHCKELDNLQ